MIGVSKGFPVLPSWLTISDITIVIIRIVVSPISGNHIAANTYASGAGPEGRCTLRYRERELADFVENAAEGLHRVGPDGIILWASKAELALLGYRWEEYVGHHIAEFHVDAAVIDDILSRLSNGETRYDVPARLRCRDGTIRHALIHSNACFVGGQMRYTRCFTRAAAVIARQVGHMTGLVVLAKAPLDLRDVVAEATEQTAPHLHARRQRLALDLPAAPAWVHGDRKRIIQVAVNLLANASKFAPEGAMSGWGSGWGCTTRN